MLAPVRRVVIYGNGGTGKSTLARALAAALGGPHVEIDGLAFTDDYAHVALEDLRAAFSDAITAHERWVVEGVHRDELTMALEQADTFVWLDLPRRTATRRLVTRIVLHLVTRRVRHGQRTTLRTLRRREVPFVRKTIAAHARRRAHGEAFSTLAARCGVDVVRLTSARHVRRWLREIGAGGGAVR